jgi:hypothetical protein
VRSPLDLRGSRLDEYSESSRGMAY